MPLTSFGQTAPKLITLTYANKYVLGHYEDNFRKLRDKFVELAGLSGGYNTYKYNRAPQGVGIIKQDLTMFSTTKSAMQTLRDTIGALPEWGIQPLYMTPINPALAQRFCYAACVDVAMPREEGGLSHYHQPVSLTFKVEDPAWVAVGTGFPIIGVNFTIGSTTIGGGSGTVVNYTGAIEEAAITNAGNMSTYPAFSIVLSGGNAMTPPFKIQRIVSGAVVDEISYNLALVTGDSLFIDCAAQRISLNGNDAYNLNFDFLYPEWISLASGANTLRFVSGAASDACTITVYATERYYE